MYNSEGTENLIIFSGGCGGQNRNDVLLRMLLSLTKIEILKTIIAHFLICGHSFIPCDTDFDQDKGIVRRMGKKKEKIH